MKKLMIATAALCAAVGASALESANVVGYTDNTMNSGTGFTMAAPTFLTVGETTQCTLADLKVTGYPAPVWDEDDEEYKGGCPGSFVLRLLSASGTAEGTYYWVDDGEHAAGWYANQVGAAIPGGASSVVITAGRGLWISGKGYKLVSAGEVNKNIVAFTTNSGTGFTAAGNCMPVDMTLDQFYVTGYSAPVWDEDDEEYKGGCPGSFVLRLLTASGTAEGTYYWVDDGEHAAGWYANQVGAAIPGGASSVVITAGRGLWISGKGYTFNIPAPASL